MEDQDRDLVPGVVGAEVAGDIQSVLDRITSNRDQRGDTEKFEIPTWDGALLAEYQILDTIEIQKMVRKARARAVGSGNAGVESDADFLIKACVGIYGYDAESDTEFKISDGFDMALADKLKPKFPKGHPQEGQPVPINSPTELVVYMMKWKKVVITAYSQKIGRWMQNPTINFGDPQ